MIVRIFDLLQISIKNITGKWAALIALGMAISMFCLCFAGTVFMTVQQEKSMPFELVASTESSLGITETMFAEIIKITNVEDTTPVIQLPVQINMGEYSAALTLAGISPSYLKNCTLPENSVMPYIALNEAACKLFSKNNNKVAAAATEVPEIDWLNTTATVLTDKESTPVTAKVYAVLENKKDDEPTAYISLNAAKSLLKTSGQQAVCMSAYVRISNIGSSDSVSRALDALQLTTANADTELQAKWDSWSKDMVYLFLMGVFILICSGVLLFAQRSLDVIKVPEEYTMLYWLGMKQKDIARIFVLKSTLLLLIGISTGFLSALLLPSFLPLDLKGISIFMLPIPINIIFFSIIMCMSINIPFWFTKY